MSAPSERIHQRQGSLEPVLLTHAEHCSEDYLERDPLSAGAQRERLAHRPRLDITLGDLPDGFLPAPHVLAVERRQQQLALAQVGPLVQGQHRIWTDAWAQHLGRCLTGVVHRGITAEHLLDQLGFGHIDHQPKAGEPGSRYRSVPGVERPDIGQRVPHIVHRAEQSPGRAWPRREPARSHGPNVPELSRSPAAERSQPGSVSLIHSPAAGRWAGSMAWGTSDS